MSVNRYPALEVTVDWDRYPWAKAALRRKLSSLILPLPIRSAAALSEACDANVYRPGTVLFYRSHMPVACYLVRYGSISLEFGHGNRAARGIVIEGPAVLGHWHAVNQSAFPATARAVTRAIVGAIPLRQTGHLRFAKADDRAPGGAL